MENIIRKVLLEYVQDMGEIDHTIHSKERIIGRIINPKEVPVQFNYKIGEKWRYEYVGTYAIPENIKSKILSSVDKLLEYDVPLDESYAVILYHFDISPSDVNFDDRDEKYRILKLYLQNHRKGEEPRFYLRVFDEFNVPSTGDYLIALIKSNRIITIEYTNSLGMSSSKYQDSKIINLNDLERFGVKKGF